MGQHRKSGGSGGKGMVGFHKHEWSLVMKYGESGTGWPFYGKHGFNNPSPPPSNGALGVFGVIIVK
ncbi:hypothetical protein Pcal_0436 [Pyrobaculum calidifontis JCM 11548]|uniref:50S ribosomal protein L15 n=1 Tax=Pyrobaculum calidifontis (strain DSM 21063 / JCM 11548 / VA1) TaxID=410359 RepID=A3MTA2_PYRCJ|nr:hypothetical protein Pcal_0436 [Pyrobaculum calidifontis JCM 11548]